MYAIPWYVVLFESIPEAFLMIILGFALFNLQISFKNAFVISLVNAVIIYYVRQLSVTFGLHTLIAIVVIVILSKMLTKIKTHAVFISIISGFVVLAVLQSMMLPVLFQLVNINIQYLTVKPWLNIVFFIPIGVIMTLLYYFVRKHNLYVFDLAAEDRWYE